MLLDTKAAVIDNDFFNHVIECKLTDDRLIELVRTIFREIGLTVVMHPLVYEYELPQNKARTILLFQNGIVLKAEFSDIFLGDPDREAYYRYLVKELYQSLKCEPFPFKDGEILTRWVRRKSLGEIHSMSMCLVAGCGVFLSDDGDSKALKNYIDQKTLGSVTVYDRKELVDKHLEEGETRFPHSERKSLTHVK